MKKSLLVFTIATLFALQSKGQYASQWAGYPVGYQLSSGFATQGTPGYFWLGYMPSVQNINTPWHSNKNFCIMGTGLSAVWASYKIYESNVCVGGLTPVLNGNGVTAIETRGANNLTYALAGVYDKAVYFATLDNLGTVLSAVSYPFPQLPLAPPSKPVIVESDQAGEYYICGFFNSDMYVINVNASGSVIWSSYYSLGSDLVPKDIMMNPYQKNEVIIVGEATMATGDHDGFFMTLDGASGNIMSTKMYASSKGGMDGFGTVIQASALGVNFSSAITSGFIIGGYTEKVNGPGITSWVLRLDANGNVIWSNILNPSIGSNTGIIDVVERLSTLGNYEYYTLLNSTAGMQVLKLDDKLMPFPVSAPKALYNEFVYDLPALNHARATSLSYVNTQAPTVDVGIQVYGTANNFPGFSSSYVVNAYFNGETNCFRTLTTISSTDIASAQVIAPTVSQYGALTACSNFQIIAHFPGGSLNYPCSGLVVAGSNQRGTPAGISPDEEFNENFSVFPNPVADKATVNYSISDNSQVSIALYNVLGQQIVTVNPDNTLAGTYQQEIDFAGLGIEKGVYIVATTVDGQVHKKKILYSK